MSPISPVTAIARPSRVRHIAMDSQVLCSLHSGAEYERGTCECAVVIPGAAAERQGELQHRVSCGQTRTHLPQLISAIFPCDSRPFVVSWGFFPPLRGPLPQETRLPIRPCAHSLAR